MVKGEDFMYIGIGAAVLYAVYKIATPIADWLSLSSSGDNSGGTGGNGGIFSGGFNSPNAPPNITNITPTVTVNPNTGAPQITSPDSLFYKANPFSAGNDLAFSFANQAANVIYPAVNNIFGNKTIPSLNTKQVNLFPPLTSLVITTGTQNVIDAYNGTNILNMIKNPTTKAASSVQPLYMQRTAGLAQQNALYRQQKSGGTFGAKAGTIGAKAGTIFNGGAFVKSVGASGKYKTTL